MRATLDYHDDLHAVQIYTADSADLDIVAEHCKRRQIDGDVGNADMKLAASIPDFFVQKYLNDNKITLHTFIRSKDHQDRLLNDPALAYFRVWKGRL